MSNRKISELSDGGALQAGDEFIVARSGQNYRIDESEVGNGGSQPISSLLEIPGCVLLLDARELALSDNDPVASWADGSDSGFDAAQATGVNQPTYKTDAINGNPVVRFDPAGDPEFLTLSGAGLGLFTDLTGFSIAVLGIARSDAQSLVAIGSVAGGENQRIGVALANSTADGSLFPYLMVGQNDDSGPSQIVNPSFQANPRFPHVTLCVFDGQWPMGLVEVSVPANGIDFDDNPPGSAGGLPGVDCSYIGIGGQSPTTFDGDIGLLVVYDRPLNFQERHEVFSYLGSQWGIS